jgi:pimeloyl-ACP methyl ester carboxylesterase
VASKTVVLVPGGFLGPWIWEGVQAQLQVAGLDTVGVALASVPQHNGQAAGDFADDAATVRGVLDRLESPAIVCGHSYGGAVITEATAGPHPAVERLVYLAGAAPDEGECLIDLAPVSNRPAGGPEGDTDAAEQVVVRPDGTIELTAESAIAGLFNDCSNEAAEQAAARLRPMNPVVNSQAVTAAGWRQLPTSYVRCLNDQLPELLSAEFLPLVEDVAELPTGHCPQWSRPDLVASLLLERA